MLLTTKKYSWPAMIAYSQAYVAQSEVIYPWARGLLKAYKDLDLGYEDALVRSQALRSKFRARIVQYNEGK